MTQFRLISVAELAELPSTSTLGDTKFIAGGFNIVFGASGAFKSFYTLDTALRIAQAAPVVYVAAEGTAGLYKRVSAWIDFNRRPPGAICFICQEVNLLNLAHINSLVGTLRKINPVLTVFDTLARCIPGGDENAAKDMGIAVYHSAMIQRDIGCAVAWVHHTNRAERGERGSGAMRGAADAMIELTANGDNVIRVICSKLKDDEPWQSEELRFQPFAESGVLIPRGYADDSAKLSTQELQILEFLSLDVFKTAGAKPHQMVNSLNIPERNIYRMLSHLKRELHINQDTKGEPYLLSDKGRLTLCKTEAKTNSVVKFPEQTI